MIKELKRGGVSQTINNMKSLFGLIICLLFLFATVNLAQKRTVKQIKSKTSVGKKARKFPLNERTENFGCDLPISVVALLLNQTEVSSNCSASDQSCSNNKIIEVSTVTVEAEKVKYIYTVSAGKVLGEGMNVKWDLSDVKPGTYTITAGISQFSWRNRWEILGTTQTKVVTIK